MSNDSCRALLDKLPDKSREALEKFLRESLEAAGGSKDAVRRLRASAALHLARADRTTS